MVVSVLRRRLRTVVNVDDGPEGRARAQNRTAPTVKRAFDQRGDVDGGRLCNAVVENGSMCHAIDDAWHDDMCPHVTSMGTSVHFIEPVTKTASTLFVCAYQGAISTAVKSVRRDQLELM